MNDLEAIDFMLVLIETLWNVKCMTDESFGGNVSGFNRNIVECKDSRKLDTRTESYRFNRNIVECKVEFITNLEIARLSFNRNIVECKGENMVLSRSRVFLVLIETLWNVKTTSIEYSDMSLAF